MHHYMTKYIANNKQYVTSWFQINVFGKPFCFSKRTVVVD